MTIDRLRQRSEQRDLGAESAARRLVALAIQATRELQWLSERNPKIVEKVSRDYASWPLLRSRHPKFSQPHVEIPCNLGADFGFSIDEKAQWDPAGWATEIARQLKDYAHFSENSTFDECDPLILEAKAIAPLSRETAETWWDVAEAMFLESYPQPEKIEQLRSLSSTAGKPAAYNAFGEKRNQTGRIRQEIIDRIRKAFLYAAGVKRKAPNRSPKPKKAKRK